ncbi:MAG TPA: hypothetical protein VFT29_18275 [Gemmatimonadaceae bacterium]|nr:hypothetical protein [Gemmatimonadaceae bacterium]
MPKGGPYAVACAALRPDLVAAAIVLAGVTDELADGPEGHNAMEAELMRIDDETAAVAWCMRPFDPSCIAALLDSLK